MSKRIEIDGTFYRKRRGKLVAIPAEWVGNVTHRQNVRQRESKLPGPLKRVVKDRKHTNFKDRRDLLRASEDA